MGSESIISRMNSLAAESILSILEKDPSIYAHFIGIEGRVWTNLRKSKQNCRYNLMDQNDNVIITDIIISAE